jgi:hypothetical protein
VIVTTCILFVGVGRFISPASASMGNCALQLREFGGVNGMPNVREYACQVDPAAGSPDIRVTFARLNEVLAANLAMGEPIPEIDNLLGAGGLVENDVLAALKPLVRQFARKVVEQVENVTFAINVKAPVDNETPAWRSMELPASEQSFGKLRQLWSLSKPFGRDQSDSYSISIIDADNAIAKTSRWPEKFKQFYTCRHNAILCTRLWNYAELADLDKMERDTKAEDERAMKELGATASPNNAVTDSRDSTEWDSSPDYQRHFALFRYLGKEGLPKEFIVVDRGYGEDGCGGDSPTFGYRVRALALDVAIIENTSPESVRLVDLIGSIKPGLKLRNLDAEKTVSAAATPLQQKEVIIPAKGKAIVPLRIIFLDTGLDWSSTNGSVSKKMFDTIRSKPVGSIFTHDSWDFDGKHKTTIKKDRDDFRAPEFPLSSDYAFGPEISVSGLLISKGQAAIGGEKTNEVALTDKYHLLEGADEEKAMVEESTPVTQLRLHTSFRPQGSCPILYSLNEGGEWVHHGKVIDAADGVRNEMTAVVEIGSNATHFRLAEQEPEVAYIRDVQLWLTLSDGRRIAVSPNADPSGSAKRSHITIPAYTHVDFKFDIPEIYSSIGIVRSELAVTGYYRRYSSILSFAQPPRSPEALR